MGGRWTFRTIYNFDEGEGPFVFFRGALNRNIYNPLPGCALACHLGPYAFSSSGDSELWRTYFYRHGGTGKPFCVRYVYISGESSYDSRIGDGGNVVVIPKQACLKELHVRSLDPLTYHLANQLVSGVLRDKIGASGFSRTYVTEKLDITTKKRKTGKSRS